ncbi:uncharacterized protein [Physeter macrocephalus]|uniref:Uncharacterized protein n=1 Tax=Physeter macrocephalus TaxID=9755 RepID=A0A455AJG5_PHYMC|nr:uncharacterized protein LOC114484363 [Physeter catodon]|eukprot:XP_028335889.1 leucine-rich repeat extensin-like protein 5 [Physeter catodon]
MPLTSQWPLTDRPGPPTPAPTPGSWPALFDLRARHPPEKRTLRAPGEARPGAGSGWGPGATHERPLASGVSELPGQGCKPASAPPVRPFYVRLCGQRLPSAAPGAIKACSDSGAGCLRPSCFPPHNPTSVEAPPECHKSLPTPCTTCVWCPQDRTVPSLISDPQPPACVLSQPPCT